LEPHEKIRYRLKEGNDDINLTMRVEGLLKKNEKRTLKG
jgi:hypothetical protein